MNTLVLIKRIIQRPRTDVLLRQQRRRSRVNETVEPTSNGRKYPSFERAILGLKWTAIRASKWTLGDARISTTLHNVDYRLLLMVYKRGI